MSIKYELETSLGKVWLTPTDANHIHVSAADHQYGEMPITVNRVSYHLSGHLYRWSDGSFKFGEQTKRESQIREPYMTRTDHFSIGGASSVATKKVRDVLSEAITKWVSDHENEMLMARLEDAKSRWEHKQDEMNALLGKVKIVSGEICELQRAIDSAEEAIYALNTVLA